MKNNYSLKLGLVISLALGFAVVGCKKDAASSDDNAETKKSEPEAAKPEDKADSVPDPKADEPVSAGSVVVMGNHEPKKPTDPVEIKLTGIKVVQAKFDPKNLEGATAELEIDLSQLDSGDKKRDEHLRSPDLLDIAKFATLSIKIANVKRMAKPIPPTPRSERMA